MKALREFLNDMLVAGDTIGIVQEIGLRPSKIETRDETVNIVPNSKLVEATVTNWLHNNRPTRFNIGVVRHPDTAVQFRELGASSPDFKLRVSAHRSGQEQPAFPDRRTLSGERNPYSVSSAGGLVQERTPHVGIKTRRKCVVLLYYRTFIE